MNNANKWGMCCNDALMHFTLVPDLVEMASMR